ncbi:MAG TPA: DUF4038 domain-containing protein [Xanthobacteraceae bacterium]|nr:DUF4038 domain-containing protein [Xanthobacteraceae bacterium]
MPIFRPPPLPQQRLTPILSGITAVTSSGNGSANGSSTAVGVGASLAAGSGTAAGGSTAIGIADQGIGTSAATGSSTATGAGASIVSGTGTAPGTGTATGVGAAIVAGSGTAAGVGAATGIGATGSIFPLTISSDGRYLKDTSGAPFLLCADTTWSLFVDIPLAQVTSYFATLVSQGFNAVMGNAIEHHYTVVKPPKERGGLLPFTQKMDGTSYTGSPNGTTGAAGTQGQFASDNYSNINNQSPDPTFINNSYWLAVETVLDAALANNLAVLVWPGYLGFHVNDEGWLNEMVVWDAVTGAGGFTGQSFANSSKSKMWNYGAWMAARWKAYPHIIWVMGGDYGSNSQTLNTAQAAAVSNLMAGLKSVSGQASTMFSAHWDRPAISTDTTLAAGVFDINGCYADEAVAELARRGYAAMPTKPTIGLEYFYEDDLFGGSAPFRKYVYWQFLGGIAGGFYGNEQLWRFDDGTPGTDWTTLLATQARLDAKRQFAFWKARPWYRLKPSGLGGMGTIVTVGGGTASPQSTTYVAAAATSEGDLLLAYIPPDHTGAITVDMTKMGATCVARWFDPTNATFTTIATLPNTSTHAFTPPANNNASDTDFLLVIETVSGAATGSSTATGAGASIVSGTGTAAGGSTAVGLAQSLAAGSGTAAGGSTAVGIGGQLGSGTAAGSSTAVGVGASLAASAGTAIGTSTAIGIASALAPGTGTAAGTAGAIGIGASIVSAFGSASGVGTAIGVGSSVGAGSGTGIAAGLGLAVGASASLGGGMGIAAGTGTALGAGASLVLGAGAAHGFGLAFGVSTGSGVRRLAGSLLRDHQIFGRLQLQGVLVIDLIGPMLVYRGDQVDLVIVITDDTNARVNLTGFLIELQIKPTLGSADPPTIAKSTATGTIVLLDQGNPSTEGMATCSILSSETVIPPRLYWLDVAATEPGGRRSHVIAPREFTIAAVV